MNEQLEIKGAANKTKKIVESVRLVRHTHTQLGRGRGEKNWDYF